MKLEIKFLNSVRFTKLLIAASRWLSKYSDVLNDLNVYPVPDGDTGSNMSVTLQAVENELIKLDRKIGMEELVDIVSESILLGARGNSGVILSQFIQGFLSGIRDKEEVTVDDVANSFVIARDWAYKSVINPVEGTMLTVISKVADAAINYKGAKDDFILFLVHVKNIAQEAVEETPNELSHLKNAGVVDAGGKGIFYMLEGFEKSVTDPEMLKDLERIVKSQEGRRKRLELPSVNSSQERLDFDYSMEFIIQLEISKRDRFKNEITAYGELIACTNAPKKSRVQIHTSSPGIILEIAIKYGQLTNIKIDNIGMYNKNIESEIEQEQEQEQKHQESLDSEKEIMHGIPMDNNEIQMSEIAIVTDSASDLTKEFIKDLDISIIPLNVKLGDNEYYKDGSEKIKNSFWDDIIKNGVLSSTSQPSPGEFKKLYEELLNMGYKKILSIHISSKLSGTQQAAKVAREMMGLDNSVIKILDSKSVSLGLGYQVLYAARAIKSGVELKEVLNSLEEIQDKEKIYFVVNDIKHLVKGGRIGKAKGIIGNILNLKTILRLDDGEISFEGNAINESGAIKYLSKIAKNSSSKGDVEIGIAWGGTKKESEISEKLQSEIGEIKGVNFSEKYEVGATIGAHTGPVYGISIVKKN